MKKILLSLVVFLLLGTFITNAQKSNVIKTSLTSPFLKTWVLAYERVLNDDMSAQLGFYYTGSDLFDGSFSGFAITPEFRYYLSEEKVAPNGAFIAPFFRYQSFTVTDAADAEGTLNIVGGGILIGIQRVFKDKITLSAFAGPSYISPSWTYSDPETTIDIGRSDGGVWARAGINLGVVF
jgi:Protein of unknown function (DUF3575)